MYISRYKLKHDSSQRMSFQLDGFKARNELFYQINDNVLRTDIFNIILNLMYLFPSILLSICHKLLQMLLFKKVYTLNQLIFKMGLQTCFTVNLRCIPAILVRYFEC